MDKTGPMPDFQGRERMDFTIYDVIRFYRRNMKALLGTFLAIFILSIALFLLSTKQYQASLDVLPAESRQNSLSMSGGSLAQALIGDNNASPDFANFIASLGSVQLGERLLADPVIAQTVFTDRWDTEKKQWKPSSSLKSYVGRALRFVFGMQTWAPPTAFDMRDFVLSAIDVSSNSDNRASRFSFRHYDPAFARLFLDRLVREQDSLLRSQRLALYGEENRALRARFAIETNRSVQDYMLRWITENENKIVEAESAEFFAFRVLDPISVNPQPVSPQPLLSIIISFILAVLGSVLALAIAGFVRMVRYNLGPA